MISDRRRQFIRFLFMIAYSQILAGMQTSLWTHLFGTVTPPAFWLMLVVYISLFRNTIDALGNLFFISFSLSVYTSLPEGLLTLNLLCLFAAARFLKSRVFMPTTIYFASTTALAVPGFYMVHGILSYIFESTPVTDVEFFQILVQTLMTFIFAVPIFSVLQSTDHFLRDEAKEGWGHEHGRLGR